MKKFIATIGDVAVAVGCCIGVGFLSGKEAQVFFGNMFNIVIFAVFFCLVNVAIREYCRIHRCSTVEGLSASIFGRAAGAFNVGFAMCCFVCIVTVLAGVEECLSGLFYLSKLPLYAFAAALLAALLLRLNMNALKIANFVSIVMAVALIIILTLTGKHEYVADLTVPVYQPTVYALFSVTMSLGVTTSLSCAADRKQNTLASIIASVIIAALMAAVLPLCRLNADLPSLNGITNPWIVGYAIVTILISAVTGIVANAYPIVSQLKSLLPDDTICCAMTFGLALAFSMFGFDFVVKFGYLLVSAFGAIIVVVSVIKLCLQHRHKSKASI